MKHSYIDITKLKDFSDVKKLDAYDIVDELYDVYDIQNVDDEMAMYDIACALYDDIKFERANFRAYVEKGMNARLMMELRKSAIVPLSEESYYFYTNHCTCETVEDIKKLRKEFIERFDPGYLDMDWQLWWVLVQCLGRRGKDLYIDFENDFSDGVIVTGDPIKSYKDEMVYSFLPPSIVEDLRAYESGKIPENRALKPGMLPEGYDFNTTKFW